MKTNAVVLIVSASVGAALIGVGACSSMTGNKPKKVVIEDEGIFIPGTAISKADQDSVLTILRQYKRSLYKIQAYNNGEPAGQVHGTLPDQEITLATVAQVASDAKQNSLSGWAIQIGLSSHPEHHPPATVTPAPTPPGGSSHPQRQPGAIQPAPTPPGGSSHPQRVADHAAARELVSKVAPILRKYSQ